MVYRNLEPVFEYEMAWDITAEEANYKFKKTTTMMKHVLFSTWLLMCLKGLSISGPLSSLLQQGRLAADLE